MDNAAAEFDAQDMELMEQARRETEAAEAAASTDEVKHADAAPAADAAAAAPSDPAAAPAPAAPADGTGAPPAAPATTDGQGGNIKAALRASRHEAKRLREENEALRKRVPDGGTATAADPDLPDESQLNDVREYAPAVGKRLDYLEAELKRRVPAPEVPAAFVPIRFPDDIQAAIDEVPDLLLWHSTSEHQDRMHAAQAADVYLASLPKWHGQPIVERFKAAAALVNEQFAAPSKVSSPKTLEDAERAIASAPNAPANPLTVGDLRGGATPASSSIPDYHKMKAEGMSDEDLMATLP